MNKTWWSVIVGAASTAAAILTKQKSKPAPPPVVRPPDLPSRYGVRVEVFDGPVDVDDKIPHAAVTLGTVTTWTDGAGNAQLLALPGLYTMTVTASGYVDTSVPVTVPVEGPVRVSLALERVELPPLAVNGQFFTANGQPFTVIECSDFSLYKRYLDGEDIAPILAERRDVGFNCLRVWLLNTSVIPGGLQPKDYPQFYDKLPGFVLLCEQFGLRIEFTAFTQTQTLMPSKADQIAHWTRTQDALRSQGGLLELVNEADQHDNRTDPVLLTMRPGDGIVASSGSNGADSAPPTPVWDYVLYHSNGLDQFQRKVGHNAMEYADTYHVPAMANENTRYPDQDSSETHAFDAAAGAALLTAGSCFHSNGGKFSRLFDADERRCAAAWVAGAKSIPLEFQHGVYSHRSDAEGPDVIRAYEKRLPDGRSYLLKIRP